eukprot:jgi/Mesvir1/22703/Mv14118-RA.1
MSAQASGAGNIGGEDAGNIPALETDVAHQNAMSGSGENASVGAEQSAPQGDDGDQAFVGPEITAVTIVPVALATVATHNVGMMGDDKDPLPKGKEDKVMKLAANATKNRAAWAWQVYDFASSPFDIVSAVIIPGVITGMAEDAGYSSPKSVWLFLAASITVFRLSCFLTFASAADFQGFKVPMFKCATLVASGGLILMSLVASQKTQHSDHAATGLGTNSTSIAGSNVTSIDSAAGVGQVGQEQGEKLFEDIADQRLDPATERVLFLWLVIIVFVVAEIGQALAQLFYNSLLSDVCPSKEKRHQVSTGGKAMGYAGSLSFIIFAAVAFVLPVIVGGFNDSWIEITMPITAAGVWWFVGALYVFKHISQSQDPTTMPPPRGIPRWRLPLFTFKEGVKRQVRSARKAAGMPDLRKFFLAVVFLSDAGNAITRSASLIVKDILGFEDLYLYIATLVVMISAPLGLLIFRELSKRGMSPKVALYINFSCLIALVAYMMASPTTKGREDGLKTVKAWHVLELVGIVFVGGLNLGSVSAYFRSIVSVMIPKGEDTGFYSLFEVVQRVTAWVAPVITASLVGAFGDGSFGMVLGTVVIVEVCIGFPFLATVNVVEGSRLADEMSEAAAKRRAVELGDEAGGGEPHGGDACDGSLARVASTECYLVRSMSGGDLEAAMAKAGGDVRGWHPRSHLFPRGRFGLHRRNGGGGSMSSMLGVSEREARMGGAARVITGASKWQLNDLFDTPWDNISPGYAYYSHHWDREGRAWALTNPLADVSGFAPAVGDGLATNGSGALMDGEQEGASAGNVPGGARSLASVPGTKALPLTPSLKGGGFAVDDWLVGTRSAHRRTMEAEDETRVLELMRTDKRFLEQRRRLELARRELPDVTTQARQMQAVSGPGGLPCAASRPGAGAILRGQGQSRVVPSSPLSLSLLADAPAGAAEGPQDDSWRIAALCACPVDAAAAGGVSGGVHEDGRPVTDATRGGGLPAYGATACDPWLGAGAGPGSDAGHAAFLAPPAMHRLRYNDRMSMCSGGSALDSILMFDDVNTSLGAGEGAPTATLEPSMVEPSLMETGTEASVTDGSLLGSCACEGAPGEALPMAGQAVRSPSAASAVSRGVAADRCDVGHEGECGSSWVGHRHEGSWGVEEEVGMETGPRGQTAGYLDDVSSMVAEGDGSRHGEGSVHGGEGSSKGGAAAKAGDMRAERDANGSQGAAPASAAASTALAGARHRGDAAAAPTSKHTRIVSGQRRRAKRRQERAGALARSTSF